MFEKSREIISVRLILSIGDARFLIGWQLFADRSLFYDFQLISRTFFHVLSANSIFSSFSVVSIFADLFHITSYDLIPSLNIVPVFI